MRLFTLFPPKIRKFAASNTRTPEKVTPRTYAMEIAILIVALVLVIVVLMSRKETPAKTEKKIDGLIEKANAMKYKTETCRVSGVSYRGDKARKALRRAEDGQFIYLYPEPDNKFDSSAVKVVLDDVHIGYIPKNRSFAISQALKYLDYAKIIDNSTVEGDPFVMIELVFHAPNGLTDEEFTFISTHAPERLKELKDPGFGEDW